MAHSVSVRLPDHVAKALSELVEATDRSRTYLIVKALEEYIDEYADCLIALERMRDKNDGFISTKELLRRLGRKH
ncbi:MAG: ribbon-helix-helix domain-containing protein [Acidobacteria bacterium]|jgi:predicted transcriptional regulator|nr:ribbon-helix-helix domain-containing protein [Acidobacteriota bacterium]